MRDSLISKTAVNFFDLCPLHEIVIYGDLTLISEAAASGHVQRKDTVLDAIYLIHYISSCPGCCTYSVAQLAART